ncbi:MULTISPECIES: metal-dependent hydrolase family protein [unclassified Rhizobium]|uniref:metal-dependent hydrolase family protein n=1 Tax=unclassified Rhizobium TaxID=2613769 RepID=UPI001781BF87|nr:MULTISPECIES: amidohydrolase family protein [unclassified Rhizobium]MBD8688379.1 amidohydrolase family protein [Rhizobium sp. CFBP 13644]MBD8692834.1 amidohydrolase family protein [Rhizobium sp. CFBP 13717]
MTTILLKNACIVDGSQSKPTAPVDIFIRNDLIVDVGNTITEPADRIIDLAGKTVMPGLIDGHVHVIATKLDLGANADLPNSLVALRSAKIMKDMLMRGFTTVRDLGGADHGLVEALEEKTIVGPRLIICGKALSQTGGHTDYRGRFNRRSVEHYPDQLGALGRICDGVDAVRLACREEIKGGAQFIKLMANGGVSSPTDPIANLGFSRDEMLAAVEEAENAQTYVAAHLYTDAAIRRAVECGVKSIEHGNLITPETAELARERGAFVVPTNIVYDRLAKDGASLGLPPVSVAKIEDVRSAGFNALKVLHEAGVTMVYGTDLLGEMHEHQSEEFVLRGQHLPAADVIRSATLDAAKALGYEGKLGTVAAGAFADLIVVDGNPLEDLSLLTGQGQHMPFILKGGEFVKGS